MWPSSRLRNVWRSASTDTRVNLSQYSQSNFPCFYARVKILLLKRMKEKLLDRKWDEKFIFLLAHFSSLPRGWSRSLLFHTSSKRRLMQNCVKYSSVWRLIFCWITNVVVITRWVVFGVESLVVIVSCRREMWKGCFIESHKRSITCCRYCNEHDKKNFLFFSLRNVEQSYFIKICFSHVSDSNLKLLIKRALQCFWNLHQIEGSNVVNHNELHFQKSFEAL